MIVLCVQRSFVTEYHWRYCWVWTGTESSDRDSKKKILRITSILSGTALLVAVCSCLLALWQLSSAVQLIRGDALVGVESAVAMRNALREVHGNLARKTPAKLTSIPDQDLRQLKITFRALLEDYREGALTAEDKETASQIAAAFNAYTDALIKQESALCIIKQKGLEIAIGRGYKYNLARLHDNIDNAGCVANRALWIVRLLGLSLAGLLGVLGTMYAFEYWTSTSREKRN